MTTLDVTYPAWMDGAACHDSNPADFFPDKGQTAAVARAICKECPVRLACLQWAVDTGAEHGVYGGVTPMDRRRLRPTSTVWQCTDCLMAFWNQKGLVLHVRDWCGVPKTHGTHGTYASGCKCAPCRSAHAKYMRARRAAAKRAA